MILARAFAILAAAEDVVVSLAGLGTLVSTGLTTEGNPITVSAGVRFTTDGTAQERNGLSPYSYVDVQAGQWASTEPSSGVGDDYEVRLTVNSGSNPSSGPSVSTWLALSTQRQWDLEATGTDTSLSGNWTIEIRDTATSTVQDSATFAISSTVTTV